MKKTISMILLLVMAMLFCLTGCQKTVAYTTKYITNCEMAEFRQEASNAATILQYLDYGEAVSFEEDVANGYAKVVYQGVTGYVLSSMLTEVQPPAKKAPPVQATPQQPSQSQQQSQPIQTNSYDGLISHQPQSQVKLQIDNYIRPLYERVNRDLKSYSKQVQGDTTIWSDSLGCAKKELPQGARSYNMSRQYYYDSYSGELVFAFVFQGKTEHRLYFQNNQLIRYIDENGNILDNPTTTKALQMADRVIREAY